VITHRVRGTIPQVLRLWQKSRGFYRHVLPRQLLRYLGPGFIITVGFIDPGNWAVNIESGSRFNYSLLWVISLATMMLILLQSLSARLGIVTGRSLAANIRSHLPRGLAIFLGTTIFGACIATDTAELLGGALGFHLLFGLPLWLGALLTIIVKIWAVIGQQYHRLERMIMAFLGVIACCYLVELGIVHPEWGLAWKGVVIPQVTVANIYIAMGMLGAVIMPHNIYLHSNVIQSREWGGNDVEKLRLIRFQQIDTNAAMLLGWLVNSSMIIVAAAVFFPHDIIITEIEQASETLRPLVGSLAQLLFGIALLFAGVGSSIASSMSSANVTTGFLGKPEDPHSQLYRCGLIVTAIPAFLIIISGLDSFKILIWSQVILSIQLPFTILPLLYLVRRRQIMGHFAVKNMEFGLGMLVVAIVIVLNLFLFYQTVVGG